MKRQPAKIDFITKQRRIKLHIFEPSMRKIWTIVGASAEYWMEPDLSYCSCPHFYFSRRHGKQHCYHLDAIKEAIPAGLYETIHLADSEYKRVVQAIVACL